MAPLVGTSTAIRRQLPWWRPAVTGCARPARRPGRARRSRCPARSTCAPSSSRTSCSSTTRTRSPTAARLLQRPASDGRGRRRDGRRRRVQPGPPAPRRARSLRAGGLAPAGRVRRHRRGPHAVGVRRHRTRHAVDRHGRPGAGDNGSAGDADRRQPGGRGRSGRRALLASSAALFVATDPASSVRYRSLPRPEVGPARRGRAPVGVDGELYRCPDSPIVDDIAGVLAEGTTEPLERLAPHRGLAQAAPDLRPRGARRPDAAQRRAVPVAGLRARQPRGPRDGVRPARPVRRRPCPCRRRLPGAGCSDDRREYTAERHRGMGRDTDRRRRLGAARSRPDARASSSARRSWPASRHRRRRSSRCVPADDRRPSIRRGSSPVRRSCA